MLVLGLNIAFTGLRWYWSYLLLRQVFLLCSCPAVYGVFPDLIELLIFPPHIVVKDRLSLHRLKGAS